MGVFSVIQKQRWHQSNIYSGAPMPFMQRITWSGVAMHAGVLPGYPASHGCIRMPHAFAEQLFHLTKIGMRVVVVRSDMIPVEISHRVLFKPGPIRGNALEAEAGDRHPNIMDALSNGMVGLRPYDPHGQLGDRSLLLLQQRLWKRHQESRGGPTSRGPHAQGGVKVRGWFASCGSRKEAGAD